MALPTTISGVVWPGFSRNLGPFLNGSNVYITIYDSTNSDVEVHKATDPTSSFSVQDGTNSPNIAGVLALATYFDGTDIHVVYQRNNAGTWNVFYSRFKTDTDAWETAANMGGSGSSTFITLFTATDDPTVAGCDITVRSDGDIIVVYHGENPATMGGTYQEIAYSRWEGSSWTNGVVVASTGAKNDNRLYPSIVMGSSDQSHIIYLDDVEPAFWLRALSSGNALRTEREILGTASVNADSEANGLVVANQSSTEKIVFSYRLSNDLRAAHFTHFTDDTSPTVTLDDISLTNAVPAGHDFYFLAVDDAPTDDVIYSGQVQNTSSDIFLHSDGGDVTSWSAENSGSAIRTGTVAALSANIYTRSGTKYYAFVYDDAGTIKYDEWDISGVTTNTITTSVEGALKKQGNTITTSLEGALQKQGNTITTSLEGALQKQGTVTTSLEGALKGIDVTLTTSLEGALQQQGNTITTSLEGALQKQDTITTSLEGALQKQDTITTSLEGALQKQGNTITTSLNGYLDSASTKAIVTWTELSFLESGAAAGNSITTSLEGALQKQGNTITTSLEGALQKQDTVTTSLEGALQKQDTITTSLQGALQKQDTITTSLQGALQKQGNTITTSLEGALQKQDTITTSLEGALQKQDTITTSLEGALQKQGNTITTSLEGALQKQDTITTSLNGYLVAAGANTIATLLEGALQKQGNTITTSLEGALQKQGNTITTSLEGALQKQDTITTSLEGALQKQGNTITTSLEGALQKQDTITTSLEGALQKQGTVTTSLEGALKATGLSVTTSLEGVLQKQDTITTSLDGTLQKQDTVTTSLEGALKAVGLSVTTSLSGYLLGADSATARSARPNKSENTLEISGGLNQIEISCTPNDIEITETPNKVV